MIERLTDAAISVINWAEDYTRGTDCSIDSAHIMLGIMSTTCDAAWVLSELGIDLTQETEKLKDRIACVKSAPAKMTFTAETKNIFRLCSSHADERGSELIGTVDLLAAVIESGNGLGSELLRELNITNAALANALGSRISGERRTEYRAITGAGRHRILRRLESPAVVERVMDMIADEEKQAQKYEAAAEKARGNAKMLRFTLRKILDETDE
jgi:ATP-dependent Clp protease ATP-binding subunit ClpA